MVVVYFVVDCCLLAVLCLGVCGVRGHYAVAGLLFVLVSGVGVGLVVLLFVSCLTRWLNMLV